MDIQQRIIIDEIKNVIKNRKLTYEHVSQNSGIPLSTLKKIFAGSDCKLSVLIRICESMDMSFLELVAELETRDSEEVFNLSIEQEEYFSNNLDIFLFFHKIFRDDQSVMEAADEMNLTEKQIWKNLRALERLGLLEIYEQFKVKFLVKGGMKFSKNGRLQDLILDLVTMRFTQHLINSEENKLPIELPFLRLNFAKLSVESTKYLVSELKNLHINVSKMAIKDRRLLPQDQLYKITWLMGVGNVFGLDLLNDPNRPNS